MSIIWRLIKRETRVLKGDHVSQGFDPGAGGITDPSERRLEVIIALPTKKIVSPSVLHMSLDLSKFSPNRKSSIYINEGLNDEYFYR